MAATAIQQLSSFDGNTQNMVEVEGGCLAKTWKGLLNPPPHPTRASLLNARVFFSLERARKRAFLL